MADHRPSAHDTLVALAEAAMRERGLEPEFPPAVERQVAGLRGPATTDDPAVRDLRGMLWCSIDNDDSRDLDQLTVGEEAGDGRTRLWVAIADVDALVAPNTPIDDHAQRNTTSVYTPAIMFPMLPERLSTDLTSLNEHAERLAVVVELLVDASGTVVESAVYRAQVYNQAKLAYPSVAAWLTGEGPAPEKLAAVPGLEAVLRVQDGAAQRLRARRHERGALELETVQAHVQVSDGTVTLEQEHRNRARELIEDCMIAANSATVRFLEARGFPALRRVVRRPERWDRIVALAESLGEQLPPEPDARALERFLVRRREADPQRFPDLSLAVIKLMGSGEYVADPAGPAAPEHFGLAVRDYTHSTAPNRRYPDLITQRLLKAALAGDRPPYDDDALAALARHCTEQEDAANKVERQVRKSAAAAALADRLGETFDALVTGASPKGTWVRLLALPVEGKVVDGAGGLDVGDRVRVRLVHTDIQRGFIDFARLPGRHD